MKSRKMLTSVTCARKVDSSTLGMNAVICSSRSDAMLLKKIFKKKVNTNNDVSM